MKISRVSIPIGFSRALQLNFLDSHPKIDELFQSLSGFLGRSNLDDLLRSLSTGDTVSIPIGFSRALQPQWAGLKKLGEIVSIPIGFSRALQLNCRIRC